MQWGRYLCLFGIQLGKRIGDNVDGLPNAHSFVHICVAQHQNAASSIVPSTIAYCCCHGDLLVRASSFLKAISCVQIYSNQSRTKSFVEENSGLQNKPQRDNNTSVDPGHLKFLVNKCCFSIKYFSILILMSIYGFFKNKII